MDSKSRSWSRFQAVAGTIAGIGTTSGIGSIAGNGSFVGSAPLRKDEQAWDKQERALFLVV